MTMREISIALNNIMIRNHNEKAFQAQIHGHKMNYFERPSVEEEKELTQQQKDLYSQALKQKFGKHAEKLNVE